MGMKITNYSEVVMALKLTDKYVNEETRKALRNGAKEIKDLTRKYAPIDEGNLEKAIHIMPSIGNQYSLRITIAVSGIVGGRDVDEYAAVVHEYSWEKRGPLTRMKGPKAGPRYLARAFRDSKKQLTDDLAVAMNSGISRGIAKSGVNKPKGRRKR